MSLGGVHGHIGGAEEGIGFFAVGRAVTEAYGRVEMDGRVYERERPLAQRAPQACRQAGGLFGTCPRKEEAEFVPPDPCQEVALTQGPLEPHCRLSENGVSLRVSE